MVCMRMCVYLLSSCEHLLAHISEDALGRKGGQRHKLSYHTYMIPIRRARHPPLPLLSM